MLVAKRLVRRFALAPLLLVSSGCDDTGDTESISGTEPTGPSTGKVEITVVNRRNTPIFLVEECCYPAFLTLELSRGYLWTVGGHFCGTPGTHNDPNARTVRVEPGASFTRAWSGVLYERTGTGASACNRAFYATTGEYEGRVCASLEEPKDVRSNETQRCTDVRFSLPASGVTKIEASFD